MINLDQVRTLEWKVKQAVQLIVHLRRENDSLRGRLSDTEVRLQELESLLEAFKATQNEMESGIRSALEELDHLESAAADSGPVDPLSYPPAEKSAPKAPAAPAVVPAAVLPETVPEEPSAAPAAAEQASEDLSFEEEYAALAAAEAAAQAESVSAAPAAEADEPVPADAVPEDAVPDEAVSYETAPEEEVPGSVELEPAADGGLFDEPAPVPAAEEREPEQPGLGIF